MTQSGPWGRSRQYSPGISRDVRVQYASYSPPKVRAQQCFFRAHARESGGIVSAVSSTPTPERKARAHPSELTALIARVADNAIDTSRDQRMPGLDGDQLAEPAPEHKDWPEAQGWARAQLLQRLLYEAAGEPGLMDSHGAPLGPAWDDGRQPNG